MKNLFLDFSKAFASAAFAISLNLSATADNPASLQDETVLQAMGSNAVFIAAQSGDAGSLRRLLDANPRLIEQRDQRGSTLLAYAARAGATNTLCLLLTLGTAVDATNHAGWTPLMESAAKGYSPAVRALLEAGADPNRLGREGETALILASQTDAVEVGRLLLAKGARVDPAMLPTKVTALEQAALFGHAAFAELLLTHGARTDCRDFNGLTPLHAAASGLTRDKLLQSWNSRLEDLNQQGAADQNLTAITAVVSNQMAEAIAQLPESIKHGGRQHRQVAELLLSHGADLEATNNLGSTPLFSAATFTNLAVVEVLVAHKANLNATGQRGLTPLAVAALKGNDAIAALLLEAGADANLADYAGFTPLNTAVEQGHPSVARLLLAHGANPNLACPNGQTPLHTAAGRGDIESMRSLLDAGANLQPIETAGTPLSEAVQHGQLEAVKFLLQRSAQPDIASPQNGMTALHWAASLGLPEMVRLLLDAGANVNADSSSQGTPLNAAATGRHGTQKFLASLFNQFPRDTKLNEPTVGSDDDYVSVLTILLTAKANLNAREPRFDRTPIFVAVNQGNFAAVDSLLVAGADLKATDRMGLTPLHAASELDATATVVSNIVTRLLKAGASLEARDKLFATPLHAAANAGNAVMMELLLNAGAHVNATGPNLCTPLQIAVMRGQRDIVKLLLTRQPDLEWRNSYGTTALLQAVQLQSKEIATLLLDHGADLKVGSPDGVTALMVSAGLGDLAMMKLLFDRGADVNTVSQNGWTAFLIAAQEGKVEAAKLLLEHGAKFEVAEMAGFTPLIIAARGGHLEMVKFLLDRGASIAARSKVAFTALHEAADRGHAELVEFLLNQGAELEPIDAYDATPLHVAANGAFASEAQYVAVIKVLLAHGAKVNARMRGNQTALHRAATWGHPQIVQALLAGGADPKAQDRNGDTALDLAKVSDDPRLQPGVANGRKECAKLLRKAPAEAKCQ